LHLLFRLGDIVGNGRLSLLAAGFALIAGNDRDLGDDHDLIVRDSVCRVDVCGDSSSGNSIHFSMGVHPFSSGPAYAISKSQVRVI